jgi:GNAT superfamily N-acetyltransferase
MDREALDLRAATPDDALAVGHLTHRCFDTYRAFAEAGWKPPSVEWFAADFQIRLRGLAVRTRLASTPGEGGHAVAICGWTPARDRQEPRQPIARLAHLWMLFVHPARWGTGLSDDLLGWAQKGMAEAGYDAARLSTPVGQARARAFYERHGWRATSRGQYSPELRLALMEYRVELG